MKSILLFIGTIKKVPNCGESMKNHAMLRRFREVFDLVLEFDTWGLKHRPWRICVLLWYLFRYPKVKVVVSASTYISYDVLRLLKKLGKENIYYWVIGGVFPSLIERNHYDPNIYRDLKGIFVESPRMVDALKKYNIFNASYVPNFKRIDYIPFIEDRNNKSIRFVFLSRIHPQKGCGLIIQSAIWLNNHGYHDRYTIDFYGTIDKDYNEFETLIKDIDNVNYLGFLTLDKNGYDTLSKYNMMLFPTFWSGEGFPGIIIDAFLSGLPVIATDWNFNTDLVDETTGIIIPHNDQQTLTEAMRSVIDGNIDLKTLSVNCQCKVLDYDDRNVLSKELLTNSGFFNT